MRRVLLVLLLLTVLYVGYASAIYYLTPAGARYEANSPETNSPNTAYTPLSTLPAVNASTPAYNSSVKTYGHPVLQKTYIHGASLNITPLNLTPPSINTTVTAPDWSSSLPPVDNGCKPIYMSGGQTGLYQC